MDYYGVSESLSNDLDKLKQDIIDACVSVGATVINSVFHRYSPYGVSGVVIIAESNVTIHTWPEYNFISLDIYTCGDSISPYSIHQILYTKWNPKKYVGDLVNRGNKNIVDEVVF